uniref:Uncharacterized protein n=1 Tax=Pyrodinium bahamense TaxID=73915 RepID=A0A7S0FBU2_9DINO
MAAAVFLLGLSMPAAGARHGRGRAFLSLAADMQPQVVAQTLVQVEDEWKAEARSVAECEAASALSGPACESGMPKKFEQSCTIVANAVLQASSGDRGVVQEYLTEVCSEDHLRGWRSELCQSFAEAVTSAMTADVYNNREELSTAGMCRKFWQGFAADEKASLQKEQAGKAAEAKRQAEAQSEAAQKAAQVAAAKATEQAKQHKAEEHAEWLRRQAEVKRQEQEERRQTEVAAEKVAEEAEHRAKEAQREIDEAQEAVKVIEVKQARANGTGPALEPQVDAQVSPRNATTQVLRQHSDKKVHKKTAKGAKAAVPGQSVAKSL